MITIIIIIIIIITIIIIIIIITIIIIIIVIKRQLHLTTQKVSVQENLSGTIFPNLVMSVNNVCN